MHTNVYQIRLLHPVLVQLKSTHLNILRHQNAPLTIVNYLKYEKEWIVLLHSRNDLKCIKCIN